jgi:hypothetical protein
MEPEKVMNIILNSFRTLMEKGELKSIISKGFSGGS